jgi:hypothetical protein
MVTPTDTGPETATTATPQPDAFHRFLVALATDPAKLGTFIKDPDGAMSAAGIGAADQMILKSANPAAIHARLQGQTFSYQPPTPTTVLVVDMTKQAGSPDTPEQPAVRTQVSATAMTNQGSSAMFPNAPQIFPQFHPQQIFPQQIFPQQIFPQQIFPQVFPQFHPQLVIHPQIFPQFHPQLVIHPQIFPQVHPQVFPQFHPQILPQLVSPQQGVQAQAAPPAPAQLFFHAHNHPQFNPT